MRKYGILCCYTSTVAEVSWRNTSLRIWYSHCHPRLHLIPHLPSGCPAFPATHFSQLASLVFRFSFPQIWPSCSSQSFPEHNTDLTGHSHANLQGAYKLAKSSQYSSHNSRPQLRACGVAQPVKVLAAKIDNLSSSPRTHLGEEENWFQQVVLSGSTCAVACRCPHICM